MAGGILIGNDLVDLEHPRLAERPRTDRFIHRVFTHGERARIHAADDVVRELWTAWAAKEAAYKVVSKERGRRPVFRHAAFETRADGGGRPRGLVSFEGRDYPFEVTTGGGWLHVVAYPSGFRTGARIERGTEKRTDATVESACPPGSECFDAFLRDQFSARERASVRGYPSALARLGARSAVAQRLGVDEVRVELVCGPSTEGRTPPRVLLDGEPCGVDVSLSHHGLWVAWAFAAQTH